MKPTDYQPQFKQNIRNLINQSKKSNERNDTINKNLMHHYKMFEKGKSSDGKDKTLNKKR